LHSALRQPVSNVLSLDARPHRHHSYLPARDGDRVHVFPRRSRPRCVMNTERRYGWMWLRALELADEAERLHRRFLDYIGPGTDAVRWEPPADIYETDDGLILLFALSGVTPEDIEVGLAHGTLTVSALRRLKLPEAGAVIRRLEIPHGRFVREIALSGAALRIAESRYTNGCLEVRLVGAQRSE